MPTTRVYMAGPMFSLGDKDEQALLADVLKKKYTVHLPQRDGIEVASVMAVLNDPHLHGASMLEAPLIERMVTWATRTVVALDVYQAVQGCDCVVLNLDGRVPDEGSLVEASLAWYAGRPVVPFKTTPITELGINNNPMVDVITRWAPPVDNPALLPAAVARALQKRPSIDLALVPPEVGRLCELGKMIWAIRRQRLLTPAAAARTVGELQALPPSLRSLIEPVSLLQSRAFSVVVGIIELSKLRINDPKRKVLVKKLVKETKAWSQTPGVQAAVRKNAETA